MEDYWKSFKEKNSKTKVKIWVGFLFLVILTELFYKQYLFNLSLTLEEFLQSFPLFIIYIMKFFTILGTEISFVTIFMISFNFSTLYRSLMLLYMMLFAGFTTGTLKLIYQDPRPYFINESVFPYDCTGGYGNPSGHSLGSMSIYLSLWHMHIYLNENKSSDFKRKTFILTIVLVLLIMISRLFMGVHSLDQIIFGCLLGFSLYFLIFHVLEINTNSESQLISFLNRTSIKSYFLSNFAIFSVVTLFYLFNKFNYNENWDNIMTKHCPKILKAKKYEKEAFIVLAVFLSNIFLFLAVLYDKNNHYIGDSQWIQHNFESNDGQENENSTKIWNRTKWTKSLIRVIFFISSALKFLIIPHYFISDNANLAVVMIFKLFIPLSLVFFYLFYLFKKICVKIKLANPVNLIKVRELESISS